MHTRFIQINNTIIDQDKIFSVEISHGDHVLIILDAGKTTSAVRIKTDNPLALIDEISLLLRAVKLSSDSGRENSSFALG